MCELQILDDDAPVYAELDSRKYHGSAYGMVPAKRGYLRKLGEWNYEEVTVRGTHVRVELNGTVITDVELEDYIKKHNSDVSRFKAGGHIGFGAHEEPVLIRNIAVKQL